LIGQATWRNVEPGVWSYEASGKQVLLQWSANQIKPVESVAAGPFIP